MFTQGTSGNITVSSSPSAAADTSSENEVTNASAEPAASSRPTAALTGIAPGLAGLASVDLDKAAAVSAGTSETESTSAGLSEELTNPSVVPAAAESVDDSYFTDAVFIGDSRMEGFRNASGITQGDFLTSVGMSLSEIGSAKVNSSEGTITVYQGLSGKQYNKIYLMLGANDLGFYPWEEFLNTATSVLEQIHKLQSGAVIYICSVIYVEEDKVATSYVNNENVQKVNGYLLEACDQLPYCYYLNLNELFSNGWHSLISGASADGVHLNAPYLQQMLDYLKSHYIVWESADTVEEAETE